jgi:hypothetical protein
VRLRLLGADRASARSHAETGRNGLAAAGRDMDRIYRGLERIVDSDDSAEEIEDLLCQVAILRRTRGSMAAVRAILGTLAVNPDVRLRVALDANDSPEGRLEDEGPTVVERINPGGDR